MNISLLHQFLKLVMPLTYCGSKHDCYIGKMEKIKLILSSQWPPSHAFGFVNYTLKLYIICIVIFEKKLWRRGYQWAHCACSNSNHQHQMVIYSGLNGIPCHQGSIKPPCITKAHVKLPKSWQIDISSHDVYYTYEKQ